MQDPSGCDSDSVRDSGRYLPGMLNILGALSSATGAEEKTQAAVPGERPGCSGPPGPQLGGADILADV